MIEQRTVLILGAGASVDYGFPSGRDLLHRVGSRLTSTGGSLFQLMQQLGFTVTDISAFTTQLIESGRPSIDAFVEHRAEFIPIGKVAIAAGLIPYEKPRELRPKPKGRRWYEYLWQRMSDGCDDLRSNKVAIITFNYDRSLERFLLTSLEASYGLNTPEAVRVLSSIPIIHVYGTLGGLPYPGQGRPYEEKLTPQTARSAAERIRIIGEVPEQDFTMSEEFQQIADCMARTERIGILGFGYLKANVDRLCFHQVSEGVHIFGTAARMGTAEIDAASKLIADHGGGIRAGEVTLAPLECFEFLQNHPVLT